MMKTILVALGFVLVLPFLSQPASARFGDPGIKTSLVEEVRQRCRTKRVRTHRPNGSVVYKTVRTCKPDRRKRRWDRDCRVKRERIYRPNGSVVYRTVRRCR